MEKERIQKIQKMLDHFKAKEPAEQIVSEVEKTGVSLATADVVICDKGSVFDVMAEAKRIGRPIVRVVINEDGTTTTEVADGF